METRPAASIPPSPDAILQTAQRWRQRIDGDVHEHVVKAIYAQAAAIVDRAVSLPVGRTTQRRSSRRRTPTAGD